MNSTNFDAMGKEALRAACKAAKITYGKLNNDGMRAALKQAAKVDADVKLMDSVTKADVAAAPRPVVSQAQIDRPEVQELSKLTTEVPELAPSEISEGLAKKIKEAAAKPAKRTSTGTKIEKGREEQNGVKRPSAGTICRQIWDNLDTLRVQNGQTPSFEDVRTLMGTHNWQKNTAVTQYQRWKEFNGLMPRTNSIVVVKE